MGRLCADLERACRKVSFSCYIWLFFVHFWPLLLSFVQKNAPFLYTRVFVTGAYVIFLEELCHVLVSQLFEKLVFKAQFNEWGALLLHQEVSGIYII